MQLVDLGLTRGGVEPDRFERTDDVGRSRFGRKDGQRRRAWTWLSENT
jgi:hypothetical protein